MDTLRPLCSQPCYAERAPEKFDCDALVACYQLHEADRSYSGGVAMLSTEPLREKAFVRMNAGVFRTAVIDASTAACVCTDGSVKLVGDAQAIVNEVEIFNDGAMALDVCTLPSTSCLAVTGSKGSLRSTLSSL